MTLTCINKIGDSNRCVREEQAWFLTCEANSEAWVDGICARGSQGHAVSIPGIL